MIIEKRIQTIKDRILETKNLDTLDESILELQVLTPPELFETGFIHKCVDWILDTKAVPQIEFNRFFELHSHELSVEQLSSVPFDNQNATAGMLVNTIVKSSVQFLVFSNIINFLEEQKKPAQKGDDKLFF